jgi:hypothetical protein
MAVISEMILFLFFFFFLFGGGEREGKKKSSWGKKYSIPLFMVMTWAFHSTIVDEGFQPP